MRNKFRNVLGGFSAKMGGRLVFCGVGNAGSNALLFVSDLDSLSTL